MFDRVPNMPPSKQNLIGIFNRLPKQNVTGIFNKPPNLNLIGIFNRPPKQNFKAWQSGVKTNLELSLKWCQTLTLPHQRRIIATLLTNCWILPVIGSNLLWYRGVLSVKLTLIYKYLVKGSWSKNSPAVWRYTDATYQLNNSIY